MVIVLSALALLPFAYVLLSLGSIAFPAPVQLSYVILAENLADSGSYTLVGTPFTLHPPAVPAVLFLLIKAGFSGFMSFRVLSLLSLALSCALLYRMSLSYSGDPVVSLASVVFFASNSSVLFHTLDFYPALFFTLLSLLWLRLLMDGRHAVAGLQVRLPHPSTLSATSWDSLGDGS